MNTQPDISDSMDAIFQALGHAARRRILDIVRAAPGCSVGHIAKGFDVSRIMVMKHLAVLEEAGLILSEKSGRTRRHYFNPVPIQLIYDRWTDEFSALWAGHVTDIKYRAEQLAADLAAPAVRPTPFNKEEEQ